MTFCSIISTEDMRWKCASDVVGHKGQELIRAGLLMMRFVRATDKAEVFVTKVTGETKFQVGGEGSSSALS